MRPRFTFAALTLSALAATALATGACSHGTDGGADAGAIPSDYPDIAGTITRTDSAGLRVEEDPEAAAGSAKAVVLYTEHTRILDADGDALAPDALREGMDVKVWFAGPVRESYPVQAFAGTVLVTAR